VKQNQAILVSVVVPCRNEILHIRTFLYSLLGQNLGQIEMEVLIADGMSVDGTRLILTEFEKRFSSIRILDNPERIAATGLNRAIREARGEIIIRMDAHATYAADYVRSCVEVLYESGADNVGGPALTRANGYIAQTIALAFHSRFATGGAKFRDPRYKGPSDTVMYGCWRKSTLERIGLFDEKLVRGQDYELNARLLALGGKIWQSPKITFWYRPRASLSRLFSQYFQYGFWKVAVIRKYGARSAWRNFVPGSCLLAGGALLACAGAARLFGSAGLENTFFAAWFLFAGMYAIASLVSALSVAGRGGWRYFPCMPVVFAVYHLSFALGFVLGLVFRPATGGTQNPARKVLSAITR
jgi:succinoglycan biosynthesis protein ExoA